MTTSPGSSGSDVPGKHDTAASPARMVRDGIDDAYARANGIASAAIGRTRDGIDQARGAVADAYEAGRDRAAEAYALARGRVHDARLSAGEGLEANPLAALLGGLAIGAALGALLPRTEREARVLGPIGDRLRDAADDAIDAAKGAGRDKLGEFGISRDHAREAFRSLIDGMIDAAASASQAAIDSARKPPQR